MQFGSVPEMTLVIETIGVAIAAVTIPFFTFQIFVWNKQQRLVLFTEYTKRFQDILRAAPDCFFEPPTGRKKLSATEISDLKRTIRLYLDLCSEEFHLQQHNHVDELVWNNWVEGMQFVLNQKHIQPYLAIILNTSCHNGEYRAFLDGIITATD